MESKKTEFEKREGDLRAKQVVMSQEAFGRDVAQFQREVREAEMALQRRGEAIERAFMEALRKLQNDHMDGIYKQVGSKHGFDMLLTNQSAFLLNSKLDVTDEIIKALDDKVKDMKLDIK
jgi:Skp family chaperone for outer membrane proteins